MTRILNEVEQIDVAGGVTELGPFTLIRHETDDPNPYVTQVTAEYAEVKSGAVIANLLSPTHSLYDYIGYFVEYGAWVNPPIYSFQIVFE